MIRNWLVLPGLMLCSPLGLAANPGDEAEEAEVLVPITVHAQRVANLQPASTFSALATALRFDPQIDLQARGLSEGQADITVRGGLFENTGFRLGAVTIFDPQTGHYSVELPIDPAMLSTPEVLKDVDNGLNAFNASIATVNYGFRPVRKGGSLSAGLGTDNLRYAVLRAGHETEMKNGRRLGVAASAAGSRGDGTLPYGDHDFKRFSGHVQVSGEDNETNLVLGYHDKFYGWPGAYTGFASLPETDHTKLGLIVLDHRRSSERGWWEIGAAYRWLDDDYDFDRRTTESGSPGSFEHETRSFSLGVTRKSRAAGLDWFFSGVLAADRLVRSTDLTYGNFNSRTYVTLSLAPGHEWVMQSGSVLSLRAGLRADMSNRDENALMPLFGLTLEQAAGNGTNRFGLEFSRTSQLPGYTALNSRPQGLFGGNPDLGREYANTLSLSAAHENASWQFRATIFHRRDDDLVDWTFLAGAPFLRQANPVDLDVTGADGFISWRSPVLEVVGGVSWLDKNADYGTAQVDASFYALNYARLRFTLAFVYRPVQQLEFRWDNEYRRQQENPLRKSGDKAFNTSLSLHWQPVFARHTRVSLVADNLTDSDFEEFPGTPAMGRQVSLGLGWDW
jgi:hypothetical protein